MVIYTYLQPCLKIPWYGCCLVELRQEINLSSADLGKDYTWLYAGRRRMEEIQ
jgi:hypothetical protein